MVPIAFGVSSYPADEPGEAVHDYRRRPVAGPPAEPLRDGLLRAEQDVDRRHEVYRVVEDAGESVRSCSGRGKHLG